MIFYFLHEDIMKSTLMHIRSDYCQFLERSVCDKSFLSSANSRKI